MSTLLETKTPEQSDDSKHQVFVSCFRRGAAGAVRMSVFAFVFGLLYMTAAISKGFPEVQAIILSTTVFAGSVLFSTMELWSEPLPYLALAITTFSVSSRHILMGLTLPSQFSKHIRHIPFAETYFLTDLNWILTMKSRDVANRYAYYLGCTAVVYPAWVFGSLLGIWLAGYIDEITIKATRSMGTLFVALILMMYSQGFQGVRFPWLVAAIASAAASLYSIQLAVVSGVAAGTIVACFMIKNESTLPITTPSISPGEPDAQ